MTPAPAFCGVRSRAAQFETGRCRSRIQEASDVKRMLLYGYLLAVGMECRADLVLSISPVSQGESLGSQASVDVNVKGLGGGTALAAYDINVGFDPALLSFFSIAWGNQLDLFGLGDIQIVTPGGGTVN